jgi:fructose transport system permease protein
MSDRDNYESAATAADAKVAQFEDTRTGLVGRIQSTLHATPSLVPLIVLVFSVILFGVLLGSRFFSPFAMTLILQQVQIVGVLAAAQTLIILTAGIDLSCVRWSWARRHSPSESRPPYLWPSGLQSAPDSVPSAAFWSVG